MFSSNMGYLFHNPKYFFYYYLSSEKLYIGVISSLKTSNYNSQLNIHQIFVVFILVFELPIVDKNVSEYPNYLLRKSNSLP